MPNSAERARIIARMVAIVQRDAPWIGGYYPKDYSLFHAWLSNVKPNNMVRNNLKYYRLDPARRAAARQAWNRPVLWPLALMVVVLAAIIVPAVVGYRRRERMAARPSTAPGR